MQKVFLLASACCLFLLTTACAPTTDRFFWPLPPEQPRVEFIGTYAESKDLLSSAMGALSHSLTGGTGVRLIQPVAVAVDSRGRLYVSESVPRNVKVLDFEKQTIENYNDSGFTTPFGIALDKNDNFYVVERGAGKVSVFSPERTPLFSFGLAELGEPIRIAIDDERGRIYVSDRKNHQVMVYNLEGQFIQAIGGEKGTRSSVPGEFNSPNDMAIDTAGNLYVCDQLNARIQIFDASGLFIRTFGVRGDQIHNFEGPMGIALDKSGNMWISDIRKAALITYAPEVPPQLLIVTNGPIASQGAYSFKSPMDIAIDKENRIYVADGLNRRVSVLQILDDAYLAKHPVPADWQQRTDAAERWYRDSGMTPPQKDGATAQPPAP